MARGFYSEATAMPVTPAKVYRSYDSDL